MCAKLCVLCFLDILILLPPNKYQQLKKLQFNILQSSLPVLGLVTAVICNSWVWPVSLCDQETSCPSNHWQVPVVPTTKLARFHISHFLKIFHFISLDYRGKMDCYSVTQNKLISRFCMDATIHQFEAVPIFLSLFCYHTFFPISYSTRLSPSNISDLLWSK